VSLVNATLKYRIRYSNAEHSKSKTDAIHFVQKGSYKMLSAIANLVLVLVMVLSPVLIPASITAFHHLAQLRQRPTPASA
jgi:SUMO ligase MMS21 Smc5/6 complex component